MSISMDSHMNNMNNMNNGRDSPSSMNNGMYNSVNVVNSPPRSVKDELETDGLDLLANPNNVLVFFLLLLRFYEEQRGTSWLTGQEFITGQGRLCG